MRPLDIINAPWAIQPAMLNQIIDIYRAHVLGPKIDIDALEARLGAPLNNQTEDMSVENGTAIIEMHGAMGKRMNLFTKISGGVSTQIVGQNLMMAAENDQVRQIILDIDSGGGTVDGTEELANIIKQVNNHKRVITVGDGVMASAAYWTGSAGSEVFITSNTTMVGSIGVVATHVDYSKQHADRGFTVSEITAGKFKRIASETAPLSEEGRADIQASVDYLYSIFVGAIAENRSTTIESVLENMADGRVFTGQQAITAGLVDGVSTIDQLLADLNNDQPLGQSASKAAGVAGTEHGLEAFNSTKKHEEADMSDKDNAPAITLGYLQENHAELLSSIQADAKAEGMTEGQALGATTERDRIKAVQDQGNKLAGHTALVNAMMFDGKTTGPEAAVALLGANEKKLANVKSDLEEDAGAAASVPSAADNSAFTASEEEKAKAKSEAGAASHAGLDADDAEGIAAHCKAQWDADKDLRAEFGSIETYEAFVTADLAGNVKVLGSKK